MASESKTTTTDPADRVVRAIHAAAICISIVMVLIGVAVVFALKGLNHV